MMERKDVYRAIDSDKGEVMDSKIFGWLIGRQGLSDELAFAWSFILVGIVPHVGVFLGYLLGALWKYFRYI